MADYAQANIDPIIQAMARSAQLQSEAVNQKNQTAQLAETTRRNKAEESSRSAQLAQALQLAKEQHDLEQQHIDLLHQSEQTEIKRHQLQDRRELQDRITGGYVKPVQQQQMSALPQQNQQQQNPMSLLQPQNIQQGQPQTSNPTETSDTGQAYEPASPEEFLQHMMSLSNAKEAGPLALAAQNKRADETRQDAKDAATQAREDIRDKLRYKQMMDLEDRRSASAERIAQLNNNTKLAGMQAGMDPDTLANTYHGILDGQTNINTLDKKEKSAVMKFASDQGTSLPTNQVQYQKNLDATATMSSLLDQYRELAINYSRDAPKANSIATMTGSSKIPFTDLKSQTDSLRSQGGALASFFDQQNRKSDAEIMRQFDGLFDPRSTTQQNLQKIEDHKKTVETKLKGIFAGISPDDLNTVLSKRGINLSPLGAAKDSTTAPSSGTAQNSDMVNVQLPGQKPGQIHRSQVQNFLKENKGAKVLDAQ